MVGAIVNALAVVVGGSIGLLCKKGIPDRIAEAVMKIIGVVVLCMGITGIFKGQNSLVLLISIVLGTIIGELINIDAGIVRLGQMVEAKTGAGTSGFTQGFVTATLLCLAGRLISALADRYHNCRNDLCGVVDDHCARTKYYEPYRLQDSKLPPRLDTCASYYSIVWDAWNRINTMI